MISVKYSQEQNTIHSHFHDGHQLIYVVGGKAKITVSGRQYDAAAGTLVLIGRLESHEICDQSSDYSRYTVQISPEIFRYGELLGERLLSVLTNRPEQFRHAVNLSAEPQVEMILKKMVLESREKDPLNSQMLLFLLGQILVLCCRAYPEQVPENTRNLKLIQQIQNYIEHNATQKLTLAELAEQFHMSQSYLSHLFKDTTGCSVVAYLSAYRLLMAKRYLAQTDLEIGAVVERCGFSDNSNFSRTFKQATGLSPSQFRKQYKESL